MTISGGRLRAALFCGLLGCVAAGCSRLPGPNEPVNADRAVDTLKAALDSWKKGEPSTALEKASPPIYVIDPEWQAGAKLADYEVLGPGEAKDAQLFARVRLVVRDKSGKDVSREVTFMISTAPNLTVARKIF